MVKANHSFTIHLWQNFPYYDQGRQDCGIYYIEDDGGIAERVAFFLRRKGFEVITAATVAEGKQLLGKGLPSVVLVDWNLPDGSGEELCRWIRGKWPMLPVIFLTVRGDTRDIVDGFQKGADDYLVKPFELEVLYSRICALLRRAGKAGGGYLVCGPVSMDKNQMKVFLNKEEISLGALEYQLLEALLEYKNHTLTRQKLLELLWDANGNFVNDNTLTVAMKRLREKLSNPACIKTVRGFGYRMEDVEE